MMPGPYDPTTWAHNPQGTVPNVAGAWPQSNWTSPKSRLSFKTSAPFNTPSPDIQVLTGAPVFARACWQTPIFDLCPQLLASSTVAPIGIPILRGPSARLYLDLEINGVIGANFHNVYSCESSSPYDATQVRAVSPAQAMSQVLADLPDGDPPYRVRLSFAPPDVGVRFWQVCIIVDRANELAPGVVVAPMNITAVCY
jgi:hypothetical protein